MIEWINATFLPIMLAPRAPITERASLQTYFIRLRDGMHLYTYRRVLVASIKQICTHAPKFTADWREIVSSASNVNPSLTILMIPINLRGGALIRTNAFRG